MSRPGILPSALEMIINPSRSVFLLVYAKQDDESLPLPVGFYSENSNIVQNAGKTVANRLMPLSATASLAWGHEKLDNEANLRLIERTLQDLL